MAKPSDYTLIAAWGAWMRSFPYYVQWEQERAVAEQAPLDAVYCAHEGGWVTLRDLSPENPFRAFYLDYCRTRSVA